MTEPEQRKGPATETGPSRITEASVLAGAGPPAEDESSTVDTTRINNTPNVMLSWALAYAASGYMVLPLRRGDNRPHAMLGSGWSRHTVGSRDPNWLTRWWTQDRAANIGIINGLASGLLVIDVDRKPGKPDGMQSIADLEAEHEERLPETSVIRTPSGGIHLYFRLPVDVDLRVPRIGWLPSVDVPWQVAAWPSCRIRHVSDSQTGRSADVYPQYEPIQAVHPLPEAPRWLLDDIRTRPQASVSVTGERRSPSDSGLPPTEWFIEHGFGGFTGSRDTDCLKLACRLWRYHWPYDDLVTQRLHDVWLATSDLETFPWAQVLKCMKSARRYVEPLLVTDRAWADRYRSTS